MSRQRAAVAETRRYGSTQPRIAPPFPLRSAVDAYRQTATDIGIDLMPWQLVAATYTEALAPDDRWLYPEVADVVSRQNGKTELLVPHIARRLRMGRRIVHTAQNRELPREVFGRVADAMLARYRDELKSKPRYANGQEVISMRNGGTYRIVAPTRGGVRGLASDDLIIDEVRELETHDFIAAAEPGLAQSRNPQTLYLSNAGDDFSAVLNSIRQRADADPNLAYLEWSAAPERDAGDVAGWLEANPAVGRLEGRDMLRYLERKYESYKLAGTLAIYETEHLCRWVPSMRERLIDEFAWMACRRPVGNPVRPMLGISTSPDGTRASAVIAWQLADGTIALKVLADAAASTVDLAAFATEVKQTRVTAVAYDPLTDAELAKHMTKPRKVSGLEWANATAQFTNLVNAGRLRWADADAVTVDLAWTARKDHDDSGHFQAVRMADDRAICASLAAIRAVWLASGPSQPKARIY